MWTCCVEFSLSGSDAVVLSRQTITLPLRQACDGASRPKWLETLSLIELPVEESRFPLWLGTLRVVDTLLPLVAEYTSLHSSSTIDVRLTSAMVLGSSVSSASSVCQIGGSAMVEPPIAKLLREAQEWKRDGGEAIRIPSRLDDAMRSYGKAAKAATSALLLHAEGKLFGGDDKSSAAHERWACSSLEVAVTSISNFTLAAVRSLESTSSERGTARHSFVQKVAKRCLRALALLQHPPFPATPLSMDEDGSTPPASTLLVWKLLYRCAKLYRLGDEDDDARTLLRQLHASIQRYVHQCHARGPWSIQQEAPVEETVALLNHECALLKLQLPPLPQ